MDFEKDMRRARRRHDKARMRRRVFRQHRDNGTVIPPAPFATNVTWTDQAGRKRHFASWDDIFEWRWDAARLTADHAATCSCWMCGNPRRFFRDATVQERKGFRQAVEQYEEAGLRASRSRFRL